MDRDKIITHIKEGEERFTTAIVIDGFNMHVGVAKCHEEDDFNERLGETIALGRARLAANIAKGEADIRKTLRRFLLSYTVECQTQEALEEALELYTSKILRSAV
jgi:hypothetical protein